MLIDADADHQAGQGDAVGNFLEELAGASKRGRGQPLPAPAVDHQREGQVHGADEDAGRDGGLAVVARLLHLGNNGEIHGGTAAADEDVGARRDARHERRVRYRGPAEVEGACWRRRGGSALLCHGDGEDEYSDEKGRESDPGKPAQAGEGPDGREASYESGGDKAENDCTGSVFGERIEGC